MTLICEENVLRLKVLLYSGLLFFSFFMIIAVPVTTNNIGFCYLYWGSGSLGKASNCNYVIAIAVIFQLIYVLYRLLTLVLMMVRILAADFFVFSDLLQLVYAAVDALAFFFTLISACILSAGINTTCKNLNACPPLIDGSATSRMHTAEAGAWISFILWLVLTLVSIFWLFRQGKLPFMTRPVQMDTTPGAQSGGQPPNIDTPPAMESSKY